MSVLSQYVWHDVLVSNYTKLFTLGWMCSWFVCSKLKVRKALHTQNYSLLCFPISNFAMVSCRTEKHWKSIFKVWKFMEKQKTASLEKLNENWSLEENENTKIMFARWSLTFITFLFGKSIVSEIRFRNYKSIAQKYKKMKHFFP